jgi:hypothetical protein
LGLIAPILLFSNDLSDPVWAGRLIAGFFAGRLVGQAGARQLIRWMGSGRWAIAAHLIAGGTYVFLAAANLSGSSRWIEFLIFAFVIGMCSTMTIAPYASHETLVSDKQSVRTITGMGFGVGWLLAAAVFALHSGPRRPAPVSALHWLAPIAGGLEVSGVFLVLTGAASQRSVARSTTVSDALAGFSSLSSGTPGEGWSVGCVERAPFAASPNPPPEYRRREQELRLTRVGGDLTPGGFPWNHRDFSSHAAVLGCAMASTSVALLAGECAYMTPAMMSALIGSLAVIVVFVMRLASGRSSRLRSIVGLGLALVGLIGSLSVYYTSSRLLCVAAATIMAIGWGIFQANRSTNQSARINNVAWIVGPLICSALFYPHLRMSLFLPALIIAAAAIIGISSRTRSRS